MMKKSKEKVYEIIEKKIADLKTKMVDPINKLRDCEDPGEAESLFNEIEVIYDEVLNRLGILRIKFGVYVDEYKNEFYWRMNEPLLDMRLLIANIRFKHAINNIIKSDNP